MRLFIANFLTLFLIALSCASCQGSASTHEETTSAPQDTLNEYNSWVDDKNGTIAHFFEGEYSVDEANYYPVTIRIIASAKYEAAAMRIYEGDKIVAYPEFFHFNTLGWRGRMRTHMKMEKGWLIHDDKQENYESGSYRKMNENLYQILSQEGQITFKGYSSPCDSWLDTFKFLLDNDFGGDSSEKYKTYRFEINANGFKEALQKSKISAE